MSTDSISPYSIEEDQVSCYSPFQDPPISLSLNSKSTKGIIFGDFNQAFGEVFNVDSSNILDDGENFSQSEFLTEPFFKTQDKNIISENFTVIIDSKEEKSEKSFPFTKGAGIGKILTSLGLNVNINDSKKIILSEFKEKKFEIKEMIKDENGKIKKKKKRRKFKPDNIRKKIKARFHKDLKNIINKKLKKAGSCKLFDLLPQNFITNITIKMNKQAMGITYEELVLHNFLDDNGGKEKTPDRDKFNRNNEVMKYLSEKKEISKKSEFDKIKHMKYEDLFRAYFSSAEFENSLMEIFYKNKMEKIDYFEEYVNKALTYVDFFKNPPRFSDNSENNEESGNNSCIES